MHVHSPDNYLRVCRKLHTISIHFANKSPKLHDPLESYCTDSAIWHIRYIVYIIYIYISLRTCNDGKIGLLWD